MSLTFSDMKTKLAVILDRSGSMQTNKDDHEGGLKALVEEQRDQETSTDFTFIRFDSVEPLDIVYNDVPIGDVEQINLQPRGGTPLYDAIGGSIRHLETVLDGQKYNDVVVTVITDGYENSSKEWTQDTVRSLVEEKKEDGWKFVFLGADIDESQAGGVSVDYGKNVTFCSSSGNISNVYNLFNQKLSSYNTSRSAGLSAAEADVSLDFSDEEKRTLNN